jgi:holo-[acyl-carrier protein] synthase
MIIGIGLDLVEISRIEKAHKQSSRFAKRILSSREYQIFEKLSTHRQIEYLAGRFAAKEAYAKAKGTGIGEGCSFTQIEIINEANGKPVLYFEEQAVKGFISITHTQSVAAAQVILEDT